jgi:hypothetical protein
VILAGEGVAAMQSQALKSSLESYRESDFVLPLKKQPTARPPRTLLMSGVLTLITVFAMAIIAISLGMWWDSVTPLSSQPALRVLSR